MPPHPSSSGFFSATPVFDRADFARAMGRSPAERSITDLLSYHLRAGNIRRIARGLYASIAGNVAPGTLTVDRFLAASRLRGGAVIAYHSALELHGCAHSEANEVQVIADGEPGVFETTDFVCRFVSFSGSTSPTEGLTTVTRQGLAVNVTTLERTVAHLFDRYDLAGGTDGLFQSLDLVAEANAGMDIDALIGFAQRLGNSAAVGALGYWLQCERSRLGIEAAALEDLRAFAPRQSRYALGAVPGSGRAATGWNVILPADIVERYFDD